MSLKDYIPKSIYEPNTEYRYSPFPITSHALAFIYFISIFLVIAGVIRMQPDLMSLIIPLGIGLAFLGPYIYTRKPSVFEKTRHWLDEFSTVVSLYERRGSFGKFLVYMDGIEVRTLFTAYFIPYEHIIKITRKESPVDDEIKILTDLESVPKTILLQPKDSDSILASIQKARKLSQIGHTVSPFKEPSAPTTRERRKDALAFEEEKVTYSKRAIKYIVLGEIALVLLVGPVIMLFRYITFRPSETARLYSHNAYTPVDPRNKPRIYSIVEVTYDENQDVVRERFYDVSGIISTKYAYRDSSAGFFVTNILLGILTAAGIIMAIMGERRYERDKIYGLTLFYTSFALFAIKGIFDLLLAFPFW